MMLRKTFATESAKIFPKWRKDIKFYWNPGAMSVVFDKNIFVADLLRSQYLFEIIQTSSKPHPMLKIVKIW